MRDMMSWVWSERPDDVDAITAFHHVRDDYGELSVTVTADEVTCVAAESNATAVRL